MGGKVKINLGGRREVLFEERLDAARRHSMELEDNVFLDRNQQFFFHICAHDEEFTAENGMIDVGGSILFHDNGNPPWCARCSKQVSAKIDTIKKMKQFGEGA